MWQLRWSNYGCICPYKNIHKLFIHLIWFGYAVKVLCWTFELDNTDTILSIMGCIIKHSWTDEVEMNSTYNQITNTHNSLQMVVALVNTWQTPIYPTQIIRIINLFAANFSKRYVFGVHLPLLCRHCALIVVVYLGMSHVTIYWHNINWIINARDGHPF